MYCGHTQTEVLGIFVTASHPFNSNEKKKKGARRTL